MIYLFVLTVLAYLMGSIPTAYIFGKVLRGIDIREHGSGNAGATNVFRVIGLVPGIIVLVLDLLKGAVSVTVLPAVLGRIIPDNGVSSYGYAYILPGVAAIAGHIWTVFLRFKGGKGVATAAGVMAGLAPGILLICLIIWGIVLTIWGYVSLASIAAAVALPFFALAMGKSLDFILLCAVICLVGIYSHRSNIKRLLQGTEKKVLRFKKDR
ncbi:MAG: glycerol-3-phosphate 1-O-acyltransferase PlsY [Candidatus Omnitrophota bacterium]